MDQQRLVQNSKSQNTQERSWLSKTFGKMDSGSMRGSILTLLSTAIGSGCLALPYSISISGVVLGMLILFLTGIIAYFGLVNLTIAGDHFQVYHFPHMFEKALGKKWGIFGDCLVMVYNFVGEIAYIVIIGAFIPQLCSSFGIKEDRFWQATIGQLIVLVTIMLPLSLQRKFGDLRFASLFTVLSLAYITIVVIAEFPLFLSERNYSNIEYAKLNIDIFSSLSISTYSYACHINMLPLQKELNNTSLRRAKKVAFRGTIIALTLYSLFAFFGYMSLLDDTPELLPSRTPPDSISNDWAMVLGKGLITIAVVISVPTNLPPLRQCIFQTILRTSEYPSLIMQVLFRHVSVTVLILIVCTGVAIIFPNIVFLLNFLGGICGTLFMFVFPAVFRICAEGYSWKNPKAILLFSMNFIFFLIGVVATIFSA